MKFLLDENAEFRIAGFLRTAGHDVTAIAYDYPPGLPDEDVLSIALREQRILITNDRDFGELIFRQQLGHGGVVFFRMKDQSVERKIARLDRVLREHAHQLSEFLVVSDRTVRVRQTGTT